MNFDTWRPIIAKIIAPFVGLAVTWLNKKYGITFGHSDVQQAVAGLTDLVVFALSTGLTSVGINKIVNPGNAASAHLASREKSEAETLKRKAG